MRLPSACNNCKARKIRCDGAEPCSHCRRKAGLQCIYGAAAKRPRLGASPPSRAPYVGVVDFGASVPPAGAFLQTPAEGQVGQASDDEETDVPRDSRLLADISGKLIFVGDSAPLSFLQSVKRLVATCCAESDPSREFLSHDLIFEAAETAGVQAHKRFVAQRLEVDALEQAASRFSNATSGLIDLFDDDQVRMAILELSRHPPGDNRTVCAVHDLILAIGLQDRDEIMATGCYQRGREASLAALTTSSSTSTVESFLLITVFALRAGQANAAFLYFGLAARTAYSLGLHRAEVNARYGDLIQKERERLYKSLKALDLFISIYLGRPPALYDLDCTVPYVGPHSGDSDQASRLDDTLQALLIVETIVIEIYGRRKISVQMTSAISQRLKAWASKRLPSLLDIVHARRTTGQDRQDRDRIGAAHAVSTYYYAIILLAKPFLMYEAHRRLRSDAAPAAQDKVAHGATGRVKFAEACIDAACKLVDMTRALQRHNLMPFKLPLLVAWLFSASLAIGVGLLGGFGRGLENDLLASLDALSIFSDGDAQSQQYAWTIRALHSIAHIHFQTIDGRERVAKSRAASELFGLSTSPAGCQGPQQLQDTSKAVFEHERQENGQATAESYSPSSMPNFWDELDFSALSEGTEQDIFGSLNLFPMFEVQPEATSG